MATAVSDTPQTVNPTMATSFSWDGLDELNRLSYINPKTQIKIGNRYAWYPTHHFEDQIWSRLIQPKLLNVFNRNQKQIFGSRRKPFSEIKCYMTSTSSLWKEARPTVVASCRKPKFGQNIISVLTTNPIISRLDSGFEFYADPNPSDAIMCARKSDLYPPEFGTNTHSLCGIRILISPQSGSGSSKRRHATLGGLLEIDNAYYGLTAAHVFSGDTMSESDTTENSDDESSTFTHASIALGNSAESSHSSSHMPSGTTVYIDPAEYVKNTDDSGKREVLQQGASPELQPEHVLGELHGLDSQGAWLSQSEDWALIKISNPKFHLPNTFRAGERIVECSEVAAGPPRGQVAVVAGFNGVATSQTSGRTVGVLLPGASEMVSAWTVEGSSLPGDCGSWIVDLTSGHVYGMIVASSVQQDRSYCLSMSKIFDSITSTIRAGTPIVFKPNEGQLRSNELSQSSVALSNVLLQNGGTAGSGSEQGSSLRDPSTSDGRSRPDPFSPPPNILQSTSTINSAKIALDATGKISDTPKDNSYTVAVADASMTQANPKRAAGKGDWTPGFSTAKSKREKEKEIQSTLQEDKPSSSVPEEEVWAAFGMRKKGKKTKRETTIPEETLPSTVPEEDEWDAYGLSAKGKKKQEKGKAKKMQSMIQDNTAKFLDAKDSLKNLQPKPQEAGPPLSWADDVLVEKAPEVPGKHPPAVKPTPVVYDPDDGTKLRVIKRGDSCYEVPTNKVDRTIAEKLGYTLWDGQMSSILETYGKEFDFDQLVQQSRALKSTNAAQTLSIEAIPDDEERNASLGGSTSKNGAAVEKVIEILRRGEPDRSTNEDQVRNVSNEDGSIIRQVQGDYSNDPESPRRYDGSALVRSRSHERQRSRVRRGSDSYLEIIDIEDRTRPENEDYLYGQKVRERQEIIIQKNSRTRSPSPASPKLGIRPGPSREQDYNITPAFLKGDYGPSTAGPVVLRTPERNDFGFAPRPRQRSPSSPPPPIHQEIITHHRHIYHDEPEKQFERKDIRIRWDQADDKRRFRRERSWERDKIIIRRDEQGRETIRVNIDDEEIIRRDERSRSQDRDETVIRRDQRDSEPRYVDANQGHTTVRGYVVRDDKGSLDKAKVTSYDTNATEEISVAHSETEYKTRTDSHVLDLVWEPEISELIVRQQSGSNRPATNILRIKRGGVGAKRAEARRQVRRLEAAPSNSVIFAEEERLLHEDMRERSGKLSFDISERRQVNRPGLERYTDDLSRVQPSSQNKMRSGRPYDEDHHSGQRNEVKEDKATSKYLQDEAEFYNNKALEGSYAGEAHNGATRDWADVRVPPGTEQVTFRGRGGGCQVISWQSYNGDRVSRFFHNGIDADVPRTEDKIRDELRRLQGELYDLRLKREQRADDNMRETIRHDFETEERYRGKQQQESEKLSLEPNINRNDDGYAQLRSRYRADALARGLSLRQINTVLDKIEAGDLASKTHRLDSLLKRSAGREEEEVGRSNVPTSRPRSQERYSHPAAQPSQGILPYQPTGEHFHTSPHPGGPILETTVMTRK